MLPQPEVAGEVGAAADRVAHDSRCCHGGCRVVYAVVWDTMLKLLLQLLLPPEETPGEFRLLLLLPLRRHHGTAACA